MVKNVYNAGDPGSIPGMGRSPGGGHGNPLQYSCLENPMDRGTWQATVRTVYGVAKSRTQLSDLTLSHFYHKFSHYYHKKIDSPSVGGNEKQREFSDSVDVSAN